MLVPDAARRCSSWTLRPMQLLRRLKLGNAHGGLPCHPMSNVSSPPTVRRTMFPLSTQHRGPSSERSGPATVLGAWSRCRETDTDCQGALSVAVRVPPLGCDGSGAANTWPAGTQSGKTSGSRHPTSSMDTHYSRVGASGIRHYERSGKPETLVPLQQK